MKQIGGLMVLLGGGSFILNMLDRQFTLLMWVDNWGPTAGIAIRIGLIVVGAGLWLTAHRAEGRQAEAEAPQE